MSYRDEDTTAGKDPKPAPASVAERVSAYIAASTGGQRSAAEWLLKQVSDERLRARVAQEAKRRWCHCGEPPSSRDGSGRPVAWDNGYKEFLAWFLDRLDEEEGDLDRMLSLRDTRTLVEKKISDA